MWAPQPCSIGPEQMSRRYAQPNSGRTSYAGLPRKPEPSKFSYITWLREVDNGLNFGRIISDSLPFNNLSKVLELGNRVYTLSIDDHFPVDDPIQRLVAHHALFGYEQSPILINQALNTM